MCAIDRSIRIALLAAWLLAILAPAARAQSAAQPASSPSSFLRDARFYFRWESLASLDPRFSWDAAMGVALDLVDYRRARVNFAADYEGVLGSEHRAFELNHENFMLDGS